MQNTLFLPKPAPTQGRQQFTAKDPPATWAASYIGPREDNEDDYSRADQEISGYDWRRKGCLYVLADGMGGLGFGAEAARIAVIEVISHYTSRSRSDDVAGSLTRAVQHANLQIYRAAEQRGERMGSTIAACVLKDGKATFAHAGDSRIYHLTGNNLHRRTRDHLYATEVLGIKDENEAKQSPEGHKITRALGKDPMIEVDINEVNYSPGDRFLLCSDGFSEPLSDGEIEECMTEEKTPQRVVHALWARAADRLTDNATAIVIFASGKKIRRRRVIKRAALSFASLCLLASAAVAGLEVWKVYGSKSAEALTSSKSTIPPSEQNKPKKIWKKITISNETKQPIYLLFGKDSEWGILVEKSLDFEWSNGDIFWRYEIDKKEDFKQKIPDLTSDLKSGVKGIKDENDVWKQVVDLNPPSNSTDAETRKLITISNETKRPIYLLFGKDSSWGIRIGKSLKLKWLHYSAANTYWRYEEDKREEHIQKVSAVKNGETIRIGDEKDDVWKQVKAGSAENTQQSQSGRNSSVSSPIIDQKKSKLLPDHDKNVKQDRSDGDAGSKSLTNPTNPTNPDSNAIDSKQTDGKGNTSPPPASPKPVETQKTDQEKKDPPPEHDNNVRQDSGDDNQSTVKNPTAKTNTPTAIVQSATTDKAAKGKQEKKGFKGFLKKIYPFGKNSKSQNSSPNK